eukprot:1627530-Amphidinium_carterae.1
MLPSVAPRQCCAWRLLETQPSIMACRVLASDSIRSDFGSSLGVLKLLSFLPISVFDLQCIGKMSAVMSTLRRRPQRGVA